MAVNIYARNIEDESVTIAPGDVFHAICHGKLIGTFQNLGQLVTAEDGAYLLDIENESYVNVKLSWFNDKAIEKLERTVSNDV